MRRVTYSLTFQTQLEALLNQGLSHFGADVIADKRNRVRRTIEILLARHPQTKQLHLDLGLVVYPVSKTPFVVLYDYDDAELRVHFILHRHASLDDLNPASVIW